jgi:hypothetical protein
MVHACSSRTPNWILPEPTYFDDNIESYTTTSLDFRTDEAWCP